MNNVSLYFKDNKPVVIIDRHMIQDLRYFNIDKYDNEGVEITISLKCNLITLDTEESSNQPRYVGISRVSRVNINTDTEKFTETQ